MPFPVVCDHWISSSKITLWKFYHKEHFLMFKFIFIFFHECGTLMLFSFHFVSQVVGLFAVNVNMIFCVCVDVNHSLIH